MRALEPTQYSCFGSKTSEKKSLPLLSIKKLDVPDVLLTPEEIHRLWKKVTTGCFKRELPRNI
jgi:hypothetical protein